MTTASLDADRLADWAAFADHLADEADGISLPIARGEFAVDIKDDGTPVTIADRRIEARLRAQIGAAFPGHAVLGEEEGLIGDPDAPTWVIDPIDGTKNFTLGNPVWATLIALVVDGIEVLGVASAPALGSRWSAVRGIGATRDGHPIAVSDVARLDEAMVTFGGLRYFHDRGHGELITTLTAATARQRGFGDFWGHCLVAEGAADVAIEAAVSRWDLAAVKCIVEVAGGRFSDFTGSATADGGNAISTNGALHEAVLALVGG